MRPACGLLIEFENEITWTKIWLEIHKPLVWKLLHAWNKNKPNENKEQY